MWNFTNDEEFRALRAANHWRRADVWANHAVFHPRMAELVVPGARFLTVLREPAARWVSAVRYFTPALFEHAHCDINALVARFGCAAPRLNELEAAARLRAGSGLSGGGAARAEASLEPLSADAFDVLPDMPQLQDNSMCRDLGIEPSGGAAEDEGLARLRGWDVLVLEQLDSSLARLQRKRAGEPKGGTHHILGGQSHGRAAAPPPVRLLTHSSPSASPAPGTACRTTTWSPST